MYNELANGQLSFLDGRVICWFSCGAASAVAAKCTVDKYGDECLIVNCDTKRDEHPDNYRFFNDVQNWIGHDITEINGKYQTIDECFSVTRYMSGINGARCTTELKKRPRLDMQWAEDTHIFGFTVDEAKRIRDFRFNNPDMLLEFILADRNITKQKCYSILLNAGIKLPDMYLLGYRNNNCLGCVKSKSPGYWSKIRDDFPSAFIERATRSRELGVRLVELNGKRIFLDELPEKEYKYNGENISCGPDCGGY